MTDEKEFKKFKHKQQLILVQSYKRIYQGVLALVLPMEYFAFDGGQSA